MAALSLGLMASPTTGMTDEQLAGARVITGFSGHHPPKALRRMISAGQVSGVILFDGNVGSRSSVRRLTSELQERQDELRRGNVAPMRLAFVSPHQFYGIDVNPFAVELPAAIRWSFDAAAGGRVALPVLHLHGGASSPRFAEGRRILEEYFPTADQHVLPDANHLLPAQQPAVIAELLEKFWRPMAS